MRIDIFSLFPEYFAGALSTTVLSRAIAADILDVRVHDPREHATDRHRSVDDAPFGGGAGMVMMPGPLFDAVDATQPPRPLLLLSPGGRRFDQNYAHELAALNGFSLICGRYEGVDHRVTEYLCDGEISLGDFVLAGGEAGALAVLEAVARLVPNVLGNGESSLDESFTAGLLEYPQYTRPAEFRGMAIPEVLRSGDHAKVARWRRAQALRRTQLVRPDLAVLRAETLSPEETAIDQAVLEEFPDR